MCCQLLPISSCSDWLVILFCLVIHEMTLKKCKKIFKINSNEINARDDGYDHIIRTRYIIFNQINRNSFSCKRENVPLQSNYNPLMGEYRTKFKCLQKTEQPKHNFRKFKSNTLRNQVKKDITCICRMIEKNK